MKRLILSLIIIGSCMTNALAGNMPETYEKLEWTEKTGDLFFQYQGRSGEGLAARVDLNGVTLGSSEGR